MKPHKISTLLFITDPDDRLLMIERKKAPNLGMWSPPGGKLETQTGESAHQCAVREAYEETGMQLSINDIHLFGMVSERGYEGATHWLMFLFHVIPPLEALPKSIDEGTFSWFSRAEIESLPIPPGDSELVWPLFDEKRTGFTCVHADFQGDNLEIEIEESM
ncbi:MAG: NUDIX domain-containing protein [Opitutales bacterium]|nr:NUDIX domain-containing protein [Opitutales bacterium]